MTDVCPDWKQERRTKDRDALARARLSGEACAACGRPPANAHHLLPKGSPWFGDDVAENLVLLCGSGTMLCHGAVHGSPYVDEKTGKRWDEKTVRAAVGAYLLRRRRDAIDYVLAKLGETAGRAYLRDRYHLDLPVDYPSAT